MNVNNETTNIINNIVLNNITNDSVSLEIQGDEAHRNSRRRNIPDASAASQWHLYLDVLLQ